MGDVPPMLIDVPPTPTDEEARAHFAEVRQRSGKITVDDVVALARTRQVAFYPLVARLEALCILRAGIGRTLRRSGFDPEAEAAPRGPG